MDGKTSKAAACKKPKLSLQKNAKTTQLASIDKLLTLPSSDLNETCEFQKPIKKLSRHNNVSLKQTRNKQGHTMATCVTTVQENCESDTTSSKTESEEERLNKCPTCGKDFQQNALSKHVQECLKAKFARKVNTEHAEIGTVPLVKQQTKKEDTGDSYVCQICSKTLSHLNSQRRTQHVNRCIDKLEEEQREAELQRKAMESARNAVLDCPMCGKPCKTENSRKTHMKRCAHDLKVPTEQVLTLVKTQEQEYHANLAAGILPVSSRPRKTTQSSTSNRRKAKKPTNKLEEDMQVAIALSSSLKEEENKQKDLIGQQVIQNSSSAQNALSSAIGSMENKKQKRKKKVADSQPLLFVLTDKERKQRLQEKISTLLVPQEDEEDEIDNTPTFCDSKLLKCREQDTESSNNAPHLWNRSILNEQNLEKYEKKEFFYVSSLMPPVEQCEVTAGSKIKSMSQIPGRRISTYIQSSQKASHHTDIESDNQPQDLIVASTQTAVVLAELADDEESEEDIVTCSGFCPEKLIKIKPSLQTGMNENLRSCFLNLVNSPASSDLSIVTAMGETVHTHSVIVAARCPKLLELQKDCRISLPDIPRDIILCVLKYVYAGEVNLTQSCTQEVLHLAERLNLTELVNVCKQVMEDQTSCDTLHQGESTDGEIGGRKTSDVEDVIKQIWIDSDSSSEEDENLKEGVRGQNGGSADIQSDISDEDYRDIMCSQRQKLSQRNVEAYSEADDIKDGVSVVSPCPPERQSSRGSSLEDDIEHFFKDDSFDLTCENKSKDKMSLEGEKMSNEIVGNVSSPELLANQKTGQKVIKKDSNTSKSGNKAKHLAVRSSSGQNENLTDISYKKSRNFEDEEIVVFSDRESISSNESSSKLDKDSKKHVLEWEQEHASISGEINERSSAIKKEKMVGHVNEEDYRDNQINFMIHSPESMERDTEIHDQVQSTSRDSSVNSEMRNDEYMKSVRDKEDFLIIDDSSGEETELADIHNQDQKDKFNSKLMLTSPEKEISTKMVCSTPHCDKFLPNRNVKTPQTPGPMDLDQGLTPEELLNKVYSSPTRKELNKVYSSPTRKRKRKNDISPLKSPVAVCISPKQKRSGSLNSKQVEESPVQVLDGSGVDLFCTPSPIKKKSNTNCGYYAEISPKKIGQSPILSSKRLKLSPCKKEVECFGNQNSSFDCEPMTKRTEDSKSNTRNTLEPISAHSPSSRSKISQRNFLMKMKSSPSSSFKLSTSQKSPSRTSMKNVAFENFAHGMKIDALGSESGSSSLSKNVGYLSRERERIKRTGGDCENDRLDEDIEIIGANMEELSQQSVKSPTFSSKDKTLKRKWTFKSRKGLEMVPVIDVCSKDNVDTNDSQVYNKKTDNTHNSVEELNLMPAEYSGDDINSEKELSISKVKDISMETETSPNVSTGMQSPVDVWAGFDDSGAGFSAGIITCDVDSPVESPDHPNVKYQDLHNLSPKPSLESKPPDHCDEDSKHSDDLDYSLPEGQIDDITFSEVNKHPSDRDLSLRERIHFNDRMKDGNTNQHYEVIDKEKEEDVNDSLLWNNDNVPEEYSVKTVTTAKSSKHKKSNSSKQDQIRRKCQARDSTDPRTIDTCINITKSNFITPTSSLSRQKQVSNKVWVPPSPFTPMPDYDSMNTPTLKREVQKFGVKPVGKKRMRVLLHDIYEQTHQYETDSEFEDEKEEKDTADVADEVEDSGDDEGDDMSFNSSQESVRSDLLEETAMPEELEGEEIPSTQQVKDGKELKEKLLDFVQTRPDVHTMILTYEPLELDWLKKEITEAGIKCSMDKLRDFLDEMCITFTMKKMRQERAARKGQGRGRKKGSPKKQSPRKKSPKKKSPKKRSPKKCPKKAKSDVCV